MPPWTVMLAWSIVLFPFQALAEAETTKALESFTRGSRMWLSSTSVRVNPAKSKHYTNQATGDLQIFVDDGSHLEKGQVWATSKPKQMLLNERASRIESLLAQEKIRLMELDYRDQLDQTREQIADLDQQAKRLEVIVNSSQYARDSQILHESRTAIERTKEQIIRLKQRYQAQFDRTQLDAEIAKIRLEEERRENESRLMKKTAEFRAPFEGRIQFEFPQTEETPTLPYTLWLENGDPIATIVNDQHYEVEVPATAAGVSTVNFDTLTLKINPGSPELSIDAKFDYQKIDRVTGNSIQMLYFRVVEEDIEKAAKLQGSNPIAILYSQLEEPAYLVPKTYLLSQMGNEPQQKSWSKIVKDCWPGAKVIAIGYHTLAIDRETAEEAKK